MRQVWHKVAGNIAIEELQHKQPHRQDWTKFTFAPSMIYLLKNSADRIVL
jgi:hypothetical protein